MQDVTVVLLERYEKMGCEGFFGAEVDAGYRIPGAFFFLAECLHG